MNDWQGNGRRLATGLLIALVGLAAGCGGGGSKAKVQGKVTANGQPVSGGSLMLAPAAGLESKPASAAIKSDGTFEVGTDNVNDGAAIGKYTVTYAAPGDEQAEWDGYGKAPPVKVSPYKFMVPKETALEVKSGQNELTIELVPGSPR